MNVPVNTSIYNLKQAEEFINYHNNDCLLNLEYFLDDLLLQRESWSDFTQMEDEVKRKLNDIHLQRYSEDSHSQMILEISFDCVVFNRLHDFLIPLLYQTFEQDDRSFFDKCSELSSENVTAEQLGAPEDFAVPLLAAVVELASLDTHKSPLEKLQCLCTTYDLIFAELKTALIDVKSRNSNTESEIPVINNSEIIPILMTVIIRSKPIHLCSNLYYVDAFIGCLHEEDNVRHVLSSFKQAISRLKTTTQQALKPSCGKVCKDLDLIKLIKITSDIHTKNAEEVMTPLDGQMLRITDLIVTSTNENYPVL